MVLFYKKSSKIAKCIKVNTIIIINMKISYAITKKYN